MDKTKDLMTSLGRSPNHPNTTGEASSQDCSSGTSLFLRSKKQGQKPGSASRQETSCSGDVASGTSDTSEEVYPRPRVYYSLLDQAYMWGNCPDVTSFKMPEDFLSILDKQMIGPTTRKIKKSHFPAQSFLPKVQIPFQRLPGQLPRAIEVDRKRQLYLSFDIAELLASKGIDSNELMPRHHDPDNMPTIGERKDPVFPIYLPLKVFDDTEYDCQTPEEWILLGLEPGSQDRKPVPGKALLPTDDVLGHEDPKNQKLIYKWMDVGVLDYDKETELYLVHKTDKDGLVQDEEGRPILNGGITPEGRAPLLPCQYWVPRVCLLFLAEDPRVFAERVASAHSLRKKTEALIRYHQYVDSMPTDGQNSISGKSLEKIKLLAMNTPKLKTDERLLDCMCRLEAEVALDYERTMNRMAFDRVVTAKPETFFYVTLPEKEKEKVPEKGLVWIPDYPFCEQQERFSFASLLTRPEVILLLTQVKDECNKAAAMSLFNLTLTECVCLEEFEQIQIQNFSQVQMFLEDTWINTLKTAVKSNLRNAGRGWYNLKQRHWDAYQMSKLCKLMKRITFMCQDSLRCLVRDSLISFTQFMLDACHGILNWSKDMEWGDDLINSPHRFYRNPLFVTKLVLDSSGVHFIPSLESFERSLISLFNKGILVTHTVPLLEKYVLDNLHIPGTPLLNSVGLHEPKVEELRETLRSAIQKALIVLQAYAKRYEKYLELNNNDAHYFLRDYEEKCPSAQEVKGIVNTYLSEMENVFNTLPLSIVIGPFHVDVEGVKQNLSKKYKALATSMLDILAKTLHLQVESICGVYKDVSCKMHRKPESIEELAELREWMKGVPEQLAVQEKLIKKAMESYQILEEFFYILPDEDFNDKWAASYWPVKIARQTESIQLQHQKDEDKFRELQVENWREFQGYLEEMQLTIGRFSTQENINKAHEMANKAREIREQLNRLQSLAIIYNNREKILGMKVTNCNNLSKMVKKFQPYHDLWTTMSDWMQSCESWMNGPVMEIEAEQLEKNVSESSKTIQRCIKQFKDSPACQRVAMEFQGKTEEFRLYMPLIQALCNPDMRKRHWEMLSEEMNIRIVLEPTLTLRHCLDMNLMEHIESITKVAEIAGKEYAIENALNKMESEWNSVSFTVVPYKETGTFILENTDEVSQLLHDHLVRVQSMSFSPFKKHFEERMNAWENKLKMTQDVLEEWLNCQRSWLYLEPIFSSEDIKKQLPSESLCYQDMDIDWRSTMRHASENSEVISLCPDPVLLKTLRKCNELIQLVQKGLSGYLETKKGAFPK